MTFGRKLRQRDPRIAQGAALLVGEGHIFPVVEYPVVEPGTQTEVVELPETGERIDFA